MERNVIDTAALFIGNGYGFGKYQDGYLFMKNPSDEFRLFLNNENMSIIKTETGKPIVETYQLSLQNLSNYFEINDSKKSFINWFSTVNIKIMTDDADITRKNVIYFFYPATQLSFTDELLPNTIVIYDRTVSAEQLDTLKRMAELRGLSSKIEFWSKIKLINISERMGYLAPKGCFDKTIAAYEKENKVCCGSGCSDCSDNN